jgi:hypothetical protein
MTDKIENKSSLSEAEKFLESLNLPDSQNHETDENVGGGPTDPNDIMSFLDEISNYPTEEPTIEKDANKNPQQAINTIATSSSTNSESKEQKTDALTPQEQDNDNGWKTWGNSFWNQASAAVKTTTDQINRSVGSDSASKLLESRVKTLQNLVNKENIEKLGTVALLIHTIII